MRGTVTFRHPNVNGLPITIGGRGTANNRPAHFVGILGKPRIGKPLIRFVWFLIVLSFAGLSIFCSVY